jgi:predicted nucleic acid-binding protein
MTPVVLDAAALSDLAMPGPSGPSKKLRAILRVAWEQRRPVLVPAVVCAEVCRGQSRTRAVESLLARHDSSKAQRSPLRIVDTTFDFARLVGTVLFASDTGNADLVDGHVIATCVTYGGGLVVTSDPDDMNRLAAPFIGTRITVRTLL